eukprot:5880359-Prymnesium_polylepis.1
MPPPATKPSGALFDACLPFTKATMRGSIGSTCCSRAQRPCAAEHTCTRRAPTSYGEPLPVMMYGFSSVLHATHWMRVVNGAPFVSTGEKCDGVSYISIQMWRRTAVCLCVSACLCSFQCTRLYSETVPLMTLRHAEQ